MSGGWRSHRDLLTGTGLHSKVSPTDTHVQALQSEPHTLTRQELQERDGHAGCGRNVCQLHDQDRERLDDDVRHLHTADGQGHHALAGTAVDKALF